MIIRLTSPISHKRTCTHIHITIIKSLEKAQCNIHKHKPKVQLTFKLKPTFELQI